MAKKKPVVPPTVAEVTAESEAIAKVVEAVAAIEAPSEMPVPVVFEEAQSMPAPMSDVVAEMPAAEDSGADSTQGGADTLPEPTSFAAPEITFTVTTNAPDGEVTFTSCDNGGVSNLWTSGLAVTLPPAPTCPSVSCADLRSLRATIDTLVYGCHSTRDREEAAKSARELLDRLIGE